MEGGFLFHAFIFLAAAVISVPLAKRLGLGSVLGYLAAGVVIGPFVFGLVGSESESILHIAEFGVVLMLFIIGLELQPSRLWKLRGPILGLGGLQLAVTSILIFGIGLGAGFPWRVSLAAGLILALSSTAIVLQTLSEKGLLGTEAGQSSFSVLLFQDIAVIPILSLLPLLAVSSLQPEGNAYSTSAAEAAHGIAELSGWKQALLVVLVISAIILIGRFLARYIFRFIAETRLREIFTAFALLLVVGIALSMELVGLSAALGTFLAGVLLADSEYRHELESDIEPFKGLLLGLFFISVGAGMDFTLLFKNPYLISGIVLALIVLKFAVLFVLGRVFGITASQNFIFSFSLAQGGEFAFVLLSFAALNGVIPDAVTDSLVLVVALSMALTPLLMIINERIIQPRFALIKEDREADVIDERNPVIIAGFGRFGQIVGRLLLANGIGTTVLDHKPGQIEMVRRFGYKVFYGDAARLELLRAAGAEDAKLFVLAIDDRDRALEIADKVMKNFPNMRIIARAFDRRHAFDLMNIGVKIIQRETFDSAVELGAAALEQLGYRTYQARRAALTFKHHDEQSLIDLREHWGDDEAFLEHTRRKNQDLLDLLRFDSESSEEDPGNWSENLKD